MTQAEWQYAIEFLTRTGHITTGTRQGFVLLSDVLGVSSAVDVLITDTEGKPVPDATVDVWQCNEDGFYALQLPDLDGPVLCARFHTDGDGRLRFWSILPSEYPIPDDGRRLRAAAPETLRH